MTEERYLCRCGKFILLKKDGTFRDHCGYELLGPGSRFHARCEGAGEKP